VLRKIINWQNTIVGAGLSPENGHRFDRPGPILTLAPLSSLSFGAPGAKNSTPPRRVPSWCPGAMKSTKFSWGEEVSVSGLGFSVGGMGICYEFWSICCLMVRRCTPWLYDPDYCGNGDYSVLFCCHEFVLPHFRCQFIPK
jgi:hypothetical protein